MAGEARIAADDLARPRSPQPAERRGGARRLGVARETACYLEFAGEQLYSVAHTAALPRRGTVLLCGPFGVERERAYLTLVRWARTLATSGFDVLRFDYRGTGESSGRFEDMTFAHWRADAAHCADWIARSEFAAGLAPGLVLHGTRMGALLAAELFAAGVGERLLLWEPPASASALLRDTLRHDLISQRMADPLAPLATRDESIAKLAAGASIRVDGYLWTHALWQEAQQHALRWPTASEARPWLALRVERAPGRPAPPDARPCTQAVHSDSFWGSSSRLLVPRSAGFVRASLRWLIESERARENVA